MCSLSHDLSEACIFSPIILGLLFSSLNGCLLFAVKLVEYRVNAGVGKG